MKKLIFSVVLGAFITSEVALADVCDLDFVKNEIKATNENKQVFSNEIQTFNNAKCENNIMIMEVTYTPKYSARLEAIKDEKELEGKKNFAKNTLKAMYCNMTEFTPYRQNNVPIQYNYSTTNKQNFLVIKISNEDCK